MGYAFEHFDENGKYRRTDPGVDEKGNSLAAPGRSLAIDPSGNIGGDPFSDAAGLSKLVSEQADFAACVSRHFYRHTTGRLETPEQSGRIDLLARRFAEQGWSTRKLAAELALDPLFLTVGGAR